MSSRKWLETTMALPLGKESPFTAKGLSDKGLLSYNHLFFAFLKIEIAIQTKIKQKIIWRRKRKKIYDNIITRDCFPV